MPDPPSQPVPPPYRSEVFIASDGQPAIRVTQITQSDWDALTAEKERLEKMLQVVRDEHALQAETIWNDAIRRCKEAEAEKERLERALIEIGGLLCTPTGGTNSNCAPCLARRVLAAREADR